MTTEGESWKPHFILLPSAFLLHRRRGHGRRSVFNQQWAGHIIHETDLQVRPKAPALDYVRDAAGELASDALGHYREHGRRRDFPLPNPIQLL